MMIYTVVYSQFCCSNYEFKITFTFVKLDFRVNIACTVPGYHIDKLGRPIVVIEIIWTLWKPINVSKLTLNIFIVNKLCASVYVHFFNNSASKNSIHCYHEKLSKLNFYFTEFVDSSLVFYILPMRKVIIKFSDDSFNIVERNLSLNIAPGSTFFQAPLITLIH